MSCEDSKNALKCIFIDWGSIQDPKYHETKTSEHLHGTCAYAPYKVWMEPIKFKAIRLLVFMFF